MSHVISKWAKFHCTRSKITIILVSNKPKCLMDTVSELAQKKKVEWTEKRRAITTELVSFRGKWRCGSTGRRWKKKLYTHTLTVIILQQDSQDLAAVQLVSVKRHLRLGADGERDRNSNKLESCCERGALRRWEGTLQTKSVFWVPCLLFSHSPLLVERGY